MIIDCIADLHGYYPKLEGGDLLIVAGDLTARDTDYEDFFDWLKLQSYKKKILISGNHDNLLYKCPFYMSIKYKEIDYLCDSGTEFHYYDERFPEENEGFLPSGKRTLKIWGSPWTKTFEGMNPKCKAFTVDTEEELASKFSLIPNDIDILVTHGPPLTYFDWTIYDESVGSISLAGIIGKIDPKLHVFGHIHECGGKISDGRLIDKNLPGYFEVSKTIFVNCSLVNEHYQPVNKPIRVIL